MKKILFICIALCSTLLATAQVKCSSDCIDLDLTFKRITINDNDAIIDFILTNYSSKDIRVDMSGWDTRAYDDEGNCYLAKNFSFDVANTNSTVGFIPPETPVKLRCYINDIDEYATKFNRIELSYFLNTKVRNTAGLKTMKILNVPFTRE